MLSYDTHTAALNYFHCKETLEALKTMDGESKSLFGKFTSARVQEWADIVRDYEKKKIYLADSAQQLIRNVNYEIPALKQVKGTNDWMCVLALLLYRVCHGVSMFSRTA